jgi:dUTP pyrophosphatase
VHTTETLPEVLELSLCRPSARLPTRSRPGDAGYDLCGVEAFELPAGERTVVPTGIVLAMPPGVAGLILPRSGLAARYGVSLVNSPGLIDPNYRGEVSLVLVNTGRDTFHARAGDRLAQLLLVPYWAPELRAVDELSESTDGRGADGFGSSGR